MGLISLALGQTERERVLAELERKRHEENFRKQAEFDARLAALQPAPQPTSQPGVLAPVQDGAPPPALDPVADPKGAQRALIAAGYDLGPAGADGKFGKRSQAALAQYLAQAGNPELPERSFAPTPALNLPGGSGGSNAGKQYFAVAPEDVGRAAKEDKGQAADALDLAGLAPEAKRLRDDGNAELRKHQEEAARLAAPYVGKKLTPEQAAEGRKTLEDYFKKNGVKFNWDEDDAAELRGIYEVGTGKPIAPAKPPVRKPRYVGDEIFMDEWDASAEEWKVIGRAPRWDRNKHLGGWSKPQIASQINQYVNGLKPMSNFEDKRGVPERLTAVRKALEEAAFKHNRAPYEVIADIASAHGFNVSDEYAWTIGLGHPSPEEQAIAPAAGKPAAEDLTKKKGYEERTLKGRKIIWYDGLSGWVFADDKSPVPQ